MLAANLSTSYTSPTVRPRVVAARSNMLWVVWDVEEYGRRRIRPHAFRSRSLQQVCTYARQAPAALVSKGPRGIKYRQGERGPLAHQRVRVRQVPSREN